MTRRHRLFAIGSTEVFLHPATVLFALYAALTGHGGWLLAGMVSILLHECAHGFAAALLGCPPQSIEITPLGALLRLEDEAALPPGRRLAMLIAGPAASLLLCWTVLLLTRCGIIGRQAGQLIFMTNLSILLINLLPALPLDGGRILYALLQRPLGESRALRLGIWLGRVLAAALLAAAVGLGFRSGRWNLTLILAAVFLLASGPDESAAWARSRAQRLGDALESAAIRPVRILQLPVDTSVQRALELLRPRERCWFLLTDGGNPRSLLDERSLLRHLIDGGAPETTLGELRAYRLPPTSRSGASGVHN